MHQIAKKTFFIALILSLFVGGCSLLSSSPSSVIRQLMKDAENSNIDGMVNAWSRKTIEEEGADHLRQSAQQFAATVKKARDRGENLQVEKLRETVQSDRARVFYLYRDA